MNSFWRKTMLSAMAAAAAGTLGAAPARAGQSEWATAGKILTGVVAADLLFNHVPALVNGPPPATVVVSQPVYYAPPPAPVAVYAPPPPVYVQPPPVVVCRPAPVYYGPACYPAYPVVVGPGPWRGPYPYARGPHGGHHGRGW